MPKVKMTCTFTSIVDDIPSEVIQELSKRSLDDLKDDMKQTLQAEVGGIVEITDLSIGDLKEEKEVKD